MSWEVSIADDAALQLRALQTWWDENRPTARPTFADALRDALESIAEYPGRFPRYADRNVRFCRIDKTPYLLLFEIDSSAERVTVVTAWSASQGEAP